MLNDNPFSEAFFKTTKYAPAFPSHLDSIAHARDVLTPFFEHYNEHHRHTGIGLMTPGAEYRGGVQAITAARTDALDIAFEQNAIRFKGRRQTPTHRP